MDYLWIIVMFLSAAWTLILMAPIHCRGFTYELCNAKFLQICCGQVTNLSIIFDGLRVVYIFSTFLIVGLIIPLSC